ncbi:MAG: hypothetical protein JSS55_02290 [Proteobacteria bacterium]|nr:hypothetical protein [Pseudomonadota bacterium]
MRLAPEPMAESDIRFFAPRPLTRRRDAWTEEAEAQLRVLAEAGAYTQDVAKALGRSQQSVAHRANRLGLSLRSAPMARRKRP